MYNFRIEAFLKTVWNFRGIIFYVESARNYNNVLIYARFTIIDVLTFFHVIIHTLIIMCIIYGRLHVVNDPDGAGSIANTV